MAEEATIPTLYGIPNCDTIKKARTWLRAQGIQYAFHDYKKDGVPADELRRWVAAVGWERVLNRAGTTFRNLHHADKTALNTGRAIALMLAHPSTIKRPIVVANETVLVGFDPAAWAHALA